MKRIYIALMLVTLCLAGMAKSLIFDENYTKVELGMPLKEVREIASEKGSFEKLGVYVWPERFVKVVWLGDSLLYHEFYDTGDTTATEEEQRSGGRLLLEAQLARQEADSSANLSVEEVGEILGGDGEELEVENYIWIVDDETEFIIDFSDGEVSGKSSVPHNL